jgi:uncharacterized protein (TIGR01777 family)
MKIVIAGASGLIGSALVRALRGAGHDVRRLVRRAAVAAPDEILWSPAAGELNPQDLRGTDAIINLAGENVGHRWTPGRRERILRSRVDSTRTLVAAMAALKPAPSVFLSASAIGYYGDRGEETLTESSPIGHGFLPEVCLAWETHAQGAARQGVRTVVFRFGTVLATEGGALARMLPLFLLGLGGRLGSGEQWMSWVSLDDVIGAAMHALHDDRCAGPMNIAAPTPIRNREFTAALGRVLHRPAVLPAPAWALRIAFGEMADEALLASARTLPKRLNETGYVFRHPALEGALEAVLRR